MLKKSNKLLQIYNRLYRHFGPQHWWPAKTPFETSIGAILTQNTAWSNVEKAINNLKKEKLLDLKKISKISTGRLASLIKPAGYFNVKAKRLQSFFDYLNSEKCGNSLSQLRKVSSLEMRKRLLAVKGIGPETADSIMLYALNKPLFVVDAYTKRIFSRHGFVSETAAYDEIKRLFETNLSRSVKLYNEYHALIVRLAKECCKTTPICDKCPLNYLFNREDQGEVKKAH
jgi:endonuclease-3 related protein